MKRTVLSIILLLVFLAGFVFWLVQSAQPVGSDSSLQDFLIVRGSSASAIGDKLYDEGLIRSPLAFKIYVQITAKQRRIQAGEYRLSGSFTLFRIVDELTKGPVELWVTIPEGYRREEVGEKFAEVLGKNDAFVNEFLTESKALEGFLFPDTYLFPKTASASAVVVKMKGTFDARVDENMRQDVQKLGYSLNQVVTMASIIERETITQEERPIVSGILYKRFEAGWALQADAAVQYAVASQKCQGVLRGCEWWPILTKDDLEISSRYNTYRYPGLPPTPIANPGLSSISAAIYPEDSDYWFYLHDSDGQIHYAQTLEEHNENVSQYLGK